VLADDYLPMKIITGILLWLCDTARQPMPILRMGDPVLQGDRGLQQRNPSTPALHRKNRSAAAKYPSRSPILH
jgi:hypothetical protein